MSQSPNVAGYITRIDRRTVVVTAALYFGVLFLTFMPPFFSYFNRAEPYVFGFSFILFWILFANVLMAVGLAVLYKVEAIRGEVV